ncbi:hypothetical protein [Desulfocicer niacini]
MIPVTIGLLYAMLAMEPDLSMSVAMLVGISGVIVILLALDQYLIDQGIHCWAPGLVLGFALVFRLMFIWRAPVLSDDIYRYLFDGLMVLHGVNPYSAAPDTARLFTPALVDLLPLVNHSHLVTLYPPVAQFVFGAGAALGILIGPLVGMKLVLSAMDMGSCILLIVLLKELGLPISRVALYAWNPLPILEIAGSGHVDGAAVFFVLGALILAIQPGKGVFSGVFMALAVLTKWVPLMFVPFWLLLLAGKTRAMALGIFGTSGCLMAALFWPDLTNGMTTLGQYLRHWEFSGLLFRAFRNLTGSGEMARIWLMVLFASTSGVLLLKHFCRPRNPEYTVVCLATLGGAYLVLSPTVYPWYALYLAVFLPMVPNPAGLVFAWSVMLSYRVLLVRNLTGLWVEDDLTPLMIVVAPAVMLIGNSLVNAINSGRKK